MDEEDQLRFGFDLFDPTKIVPEDIVPFTPLGKMTLNRNPRNYFAETEQVMVRSTSHPVVGVQDASKMRDVGRPSTGALRLRSLWICYP
jgi:catalase